MKLAVLLLLLTVTAPADVLADFHARLKAVHDYQATAAIRSDRGNMVIDYRCIRTPDLLGATQGVRTEILQGAHQGAVILWRSAVKDRMVRVQIGQKRVWRSVTRLKLQGTPMVTSILDDIASHLDEGKVTVQPDTVTLQVGQAVPAGPDDGLGRDPELDAPVAATPGRLPAAQAEQKKCWLLKCSHGDEQDEVCLDQATLMPVRWRFWRHGKLTISADLWSLQLNVSSKLE
ncbi:MAG TPA: hypothetical protein VGO93_05500 [Candidatus Xenobia bacterium]|jgi:hypothetical protein